MKVMTETWWLAAVGIKGDKGAGDAMEAQLQRKIQGNECRRG